tara:strand:+ start:105903 stop:106532 length:630 start_codon:yes stop_codon:yes gene_type:complete
MIELKVLNLKGKETGRKIKLSKTIFQFEPNKHALYLDVKGHLANKRQGSHKTKERSDIKGSTRKIKKQKGTGTARAGSIKNPIFRGGGRIFGPRVRDYSMKVNKKVKVIARRSALSIKAKDNAIFIVEDFNFKNPKTKDYIDFLKSLGIYDKKSLLVFGEPNINVYLSSRNFKNSSAVIFSELNTYRIMNSSSVVFFESSISKIESILN